MIPLRARLWPTCLAMPYTDAPLVDERLDLIRELAAGLEMLEKGRTERAAVRDLLARLDHAITAAEEHVQRVGERLLDLSRRA
jgi:hypothetical protein